MSDDKERHGKGIEDLPNELLSEVAKHLYSDDAHRTAQDVLSFRLVGQAFNAAIVDMPVTRRSNDQINRLGTLALRLYKAVIPEDSLHEETSEQAGDTYSHIEAASRILKFKSPLNRTDLVDKVLDISDRYAIRTEASIPLADSPYIDPKDRADLLRNAIRSLRRDRVTSSIPYDESLKEPAQLVLIQAHESGHLTSEQIKELPPGTLDIPKPNLWDIENRPHTPCGIDFKKIMEENIIDANNADDIDHNINFIEKNLNSLIRIMPRIENDYHENDHERREVLERLSIAGNYISKSYDDCVRLIRGNDHQISSGGDRPKLDERPRSGRGD